VHEEHRSGVDAYDVDRKHVPAPRGLQRWHGCGWTEEGHSWSELHTTTMCEGRMESLQRSDNIHSVSSTSNIHSASSTSKRDNFVRQQCETSRDTPRALNPLPPPLPRARGTTTCEGEAPGR
jgi:hypothetical protein